MYLVKVTIADALRAPKLGPYKTIDEAKDEAEQIIREGLWTTYESEGCIAYTNPSWIKSIWIIDSEFVKPKPEAEMEPEHEIKPKKWYYLWLR